MYDYAMSKFLPKSRFKWIVPKEFTWINIPAIVSKDCVFEVDLEYPK